MSKIYDALIQAGKRADSKTTGFEDADRTSAPLRLSWHSITLTWKVTGTVATVMLIFGLLLIVTANQFMERALRSEVDQRAVAITTNLSDAATRDVIGKNILELYAVLMKYARLDGAAYAFIENNNGQIVAHSRRPFPPELKASLTADERKQVRQRVVTFEGKTVYETSVPILEGQLGAAHLGMWADGVKTEVQNARLPFLGLIIVLLLVASMIAAFVVYAIVGRLGELTDRTTEKDTR